MASNQIPVAEKAKIISETFVVPFEDIKRIEGKELVNCTPLEAYIKEGNNKIPFDMVREIQKKGIAESSTLELKIRYNDVDLGKLPKWVNFDVVDNIIHREVNSSWTGQLEPVYSREDIQSACWEHLLLKSREITNVGEKDYERFVCKLVQNHVSNYYYYHKLHSKHENFKLSVEVDSGVACRQDSVNRLPEVFYNLNEKDPELREQSKFVYVADSNKREHQENLILDTIEEEMDMLNTIKSIKDTTLRDLLSIAAYLLAQLDSFEGLYKEAVNRMTDSKKEKFFEVISNKGKGPDFKKILKIMVDKDTTTYLKLISDYLHNMNSNTEKLAEA